MATKIGGLSKDNIVAVIGDASQGKPTFLTYLEKPTEREEVKAAAMIMCSEVTANMLLKFREGGGVRFMDEATAQADPQFAARIDGITVLVLRTTPKGLVIDNKMHLELTAEKLCDSIIANLPAMADKMVKDGKISADQATMYTGMTATVKNVEAVSTLGRNYAMKATKNAIYIVTEFKDAKGTALKLPFIPHLGAIPEELATESVSTFPLPVATQPLTPICDPHHP